MALAGVKGYRTYIIAALMAVNSALLAMEFYDRSTFEVIYGFLTAGGFAAVRAGVKNDTAEVKAEVAPPRRSFNS